MTVDIFSNRWQSLVYLLFPKSFYSSDGKVMLSVEVTQNPLTEFTMPFTWGMMVKGLLMILAEWAQADIWQSMEDMKIWYEGQEVVRMAMLPILQGGSGDLEWKSTCSQNHGSEVRT